jgi:hypothetical protein
MNGDNTDSLKKLLGAVFEISDTLGVAFREKMYQRATAEAFLADCLGRIHRQLAVRSPLRRPVLAPVPEQTG